MSGVLDTEPLQTLNPYGAAWEGRMGRQLGNVAHPDTPERPPSMQHFEPPEWVERTERPVVGEVDL